MSSNTKHWTEDSVKKFLYRIASDFVEQLRDKLTAKGWSQKRLAKKLGITPGRVSQILNSPGNLTLETMVEWARVLGMKVSIVAYDDSDDEKNERGPINSEIFRICWKNAGSPRHFRELSPVVADILSAPTGDLPFRSGFIIDGRYVNIEPPSTTPSIIPGAISAKKSFNEDAATDKTYTV